MGNVAILIGNTAYKNMSKLECCREDVAAMKELLDATGKYETIEVALDRDSTQLKDSVRTGHPISQFTEKFRLAALKKTQGIVWYSDIIDALRDEYLDSETQIPHFVSQGTGREQFIEDASRLQDLRAKLASPADKSHPAEPLPSPPQLSNVDLLRQGEAGFGTREAAQSFIATLFASVAHDLDQKWEQYFTFRTAEHSDYSEGTAKTFTIQVLKQDKRTDRFVTVESYRQKRRQNAWQSFLFEQDEIERQDLLLGCSLDKVQLKLELTPKFRTLRQVIAVVSCLPSLRRCDVTLVITGHALRNWNEYDYDGNQLDKVWYQRDWSSDPTNLAAQIRDKIRLGVEAQIEVAIKALQPLEKP